ncbi:MAG: phage integrase SAM-like domain-containing protein, partial [Bacteroidaceae bacterium]|nr:phage integrase SAM-like domain-containing protein [Bacteroidaceae bacterium]
MKKNCCTVVFDRKKKLQRLGYGKVEIHIKLPKGIRKYVTIRDCTEAEWLQFKTSSELTAIVDKYEAIVFSMLVLKEELTRENLDYHLSGGTKELRPKKDPLQASFIDFMEQGIIDADILHATRKHHYTVWRSLIQFGQIKTFADLTPANIMDYDTWLRNQTYQGKKIDATTVDGYHKRLKRYVRLAHSRGIIEKNPYDSVRLVHGKSKERKPLVETELVKFRESAFEFFGCRAVEVLQGAAHGGSAGFRVADLALYLLYFLSID